MRIAIIHDWYPDIGQEMTWKDGLAAAIRILHSRHEVKFFTLGKEKAALPHEYFPIFVETKKEEIVESVKEFAPDVILHWADCTRECAEPLSKLGIPQAICFAGGDTGGHTNKYFDHFFVESQVYKERFEVAGKSVSIAFGTNTELFQPLPFQQKKFDVIFPATYCDWKRHDLFRSSVRGLNAITAGFMYDVHERDCWEETMKEGVLTLPHVSAEVLRHLYAASKVCLITSRATGGSQRTVLEAMSMNIPVIVMDDSDKTSEYVREAGSQAGEVVEHQPEKIREALDRWLAKDSPCSGRDYVLSKWSEHHYADALEKGLKELCKIL